MEEVGSSPAPPLLTSLQGRKHPLSLPPYVPTGIRTADVIATCTRAHAHVHMHMHMRTCTHAHAHMHTCTHAHRPGTRTADVIATSDGVIATMTFGQLEALKNHPEPRVRQPTPDLLTHLLTYSLTYSLTYLPPRAESTRRRGARQPTPYLLAHLLTHSLTYSLTHLLT